MRKGFTLLEVLIAMAVLSISMLGIYRLSAMSVDMSDYAHKRSMVVEVGYQRVLEFINYPGRSFRENDNGQNVLRLKMKYTKEEEPTLFPGVTEITFTSEHEGVSSSYVYYEQE